MYEDKQTRYVHGRYLTVPGCVAAEESDAAETSCSAASKPTTDSPLILTVLSNTRFAAEDKAASSAAVGPLSVCATPSCTMYAPHHAWLAGLVSVGALVTMHAAHYNHPAMQMTRITGAREIYL